MTPKDKEERMLKIKDCRYHFGRFMHTIVFFSVLGLCIYVSQDSKWWTFFTGVLFILFACALGEIISEKDTTTVKTKKEALKAIEDIFDETI